MKVVFLVSVLLAFSRAVNGSSGTVYYRDGTPMLVSGVVDKEKGAAYGSYEPTQNESGWDLLNVAAGFATSRSYSDSEVMTAVGYLEGALTQQQIWYNYQNIYEDFLSDYSDAEIEKLKDFFIKQREWMTERINSYSATSELWQTVGLIYSQFEGLEMGYNSVAPHSQHLETFAFDLLNGIGDFLDISRFLFAYRRPDVSSLTKDQLKSLLYRNGHCSALIKVLPGYEDVFASHSSWFTYSTMNRIFKFYGFSIKNVTLPTKLMSFSSYPGFLVSLDDFYIMDSGVVMLQTTNGVLNKTLYDYATPEALLAWQRVRLANWMASGGEEWAQYLASFNSGTYNNQYMVLDLKRIRLEKSIDDNALWVVEQIPGYVASSDETQILRCGYWASYNVPFFEKVYNLSGYPEAAKKMGPDVTYQLAPRAKIFRRDQGNVKDIGSMESIMRYNNYMNEPYSEGSPMNTICSRGDLLQPPEGFGCYDTKMTNYLMAKSLTAVIENGPTHQGLPPFNWNKSNLTTPHLGQPNSFDYGFWTVVPDIP